MVPDTQPVQRNKIYFVLAFFFFFFLISEKILSMQRSASSVSFGPWQLAIVREDKGKKGPFLSRLLSSPIGPYCKEKK